MQASSFQRHSLIPSWILDKPEFDDTVDVVTIEVIAIRRWRRYYVQFNELYQPIRKGGQLLVKLIGSIAKQERFCPVGELDWHHIDEILLANMINEIRDRFVIPDGEIYINKILSRIAKAWRQYKSHLKLVYFKPQERLQEEHYNAMPGGISRDNWRKLYMSECGKEARASRSHIHISGGKSYANIRADYEDKHGEEMSLVQLYEDVHLRKDGSFIEGTDTQDFLDDAKAKANMLAVVDGSKSRKEVEDEVFESLMYGGELPKWPQEGHGKVHKRPLENENVNLTMSKNAELVKRNEVLEETVNQNTMLLMSLLEAMRNGKPSTELIDAAQSSLHKANPKLMIKLNRKQWKPLNTQVQRHRTGLRPYQLLLELYSLSASDFYCSRWEIVQHNFKLYNLKADKV
ncbi:Ribosomal RNA-processing protein 8 [Bienertia sinuspersici]